MFAAAASPKGCQVLSEVIVLTGAFDPCVASLAGTLICHVADDDGARAIALFTP